MSKHSYEKFGELYSALVKLSSIEDTELFLEDVLTVKELEAMAQRLEVAKLLRAGKNYQEVSRLTGASTATISRVNKCLLYGRGGYSRVLDGEDA